MLIFKKNIAQSFGIGLLSGILLLAGNSAQAFDPAKVFAGDVSSREVFRFYFDARKNGKEAEAVSVLKYAADQGNPAAQWKLGNMYEYGDGVERDALAAFNIYKGITERHSAANPNSPDGQFASDAMVALGRYYHQGIRSSSDAGRGIAPDLYQARVMFTTAAMVFRNASAQFELARMNLEGNDGMRDPKLAMRMLTLSSRKGHNGAKALLGFSLVQGDHIRANPVKGLVMLGEAKNVAAPNDFDWISDLHEEAFAVATPEQRKEAISKVGR